MPSKRAQDAEDFRFRVLNMLQKSPDLSERELARRLAVSNGKLHYCLKALIENELIRLSDVESSSHHLRYVYLLTPAGVSAKAALKSQFLKRKLEEYSALQREIDALRAEAVAVRQSTLK